MLTQDIAIKIAQSRTVISAPGKYRVKVTSSPNAYHPEDDSPSRYLVSFNAMTALQGKELIAKFAEAQANGEQDYQPVLKGSNLTGSLNFSNDGVAPDWVPIKGEYVDILVGPVESKRRGTTVLNVLSITPIQVTNTTQKFSFSMETEEEVEATEEALSSAGE